MATTLTNSDNDLVKKSIIQIRQLRMQLDDLKKAHAEPIAIVGMGCNFPGASTLEDFWKLLDSGVDATSAPPDSRWELTNISNIDYRKDTFRGGYLQQDITEFDPIFFKIPPNEAKYIDPQHRLFLEVIWQALERADIPPESLEGSQTGVFCGITANEYCNLLINELPPEEITMYLTTGNCPNFIVGRVSYILGLKGPTMAIDTACSSSLVSVHTACQSLLNKECDMAIAGGVNLMLTPLTTLSLIHGTMLSSDGRCRTFSDDADGYARGEGCGVVILKRLSDAEKNNDRILGVIKNSRVKHDGKKSGLTVPISRSQRELLRETIEKTELKPEDICYIEAHGTGTSLGDPIELEAINAVYAKNRNKNDPLYIGSVKSNIGHLESAAGIAGLIKLVLSLYHDKLPKHLNCSKLNRNFNWNKNQLCVVQEKMDWPPDKKRIGVVNSFGASGINASAIIEQALTKESDTNKASDFPLHTFNKMSCWYKEIKKNITKSNKVKMADKYHLNDAVYSFPLHIDSVPTIRDHKIFKCVVLTGSIYLDSALSVTLEMFGDKSVKNLCLKNATMVKSVVFENDHVNLRVVLEQINNSDDDLLYRLKLFPGDSEKNSYDELISSIDIQRVKVAKPPADRDIVTEVIEKCREKISGKDFYTNYWGTSFEIGKTLQFFDKVWRKDGAFSIGYGRPLDFMEKSKAYGLHADNLIAYFSSYLLRGTIPVDIVEELDKNDMTFVGSGYGECIFYDTLLKEEIYSHAEINHISDDYSQFKGDVKIYGNEGFLLCEMSDVSFTKVGKSIFNALPETDENKNSTVSHSYEDVDPIIHPILGAEYSKLQEWSYSTNLEYDSYPLIDDHQTYKVALLPAICFVDMFMITMKKVYPEYRFTRIEQLRIIHPIMLHPKDKYRLKASITKKDEKNYLHQIFSFVSKKGTINKEWALNTHAVITDNLQVSKKKEKFNESIIKTFNEEYNQEEFYKTFWGEEFVLGPSYFFLEKVWRKKDEVLAVMNGKDFLKYADMTGVRNAPTHFVQIYMHLVIATATIPDKYLKKVRANEATCISSKIENITIFDDNGEKAYKKLWAHAKLKNKKDIDEKWVSDFDYYNENGKLVARAEGVEFRIMQKKALELIKKSMDEKSSKTLNKSVDVKAFLNKTISRLIGVDSEALRKMSSPLELMDSVMFLELINEIEENLSILLPLNNMVELKSIDDLYEQLKARV